MGDDTTASRQQLRPRWVADLERLVFELEEGRALAVCRRYDGQHESGTADRVQRLDQLGADAAGMSISGVRTAYGGGEIRQVFHATGFTPVAYEATTNLSRKSSR